MKLMKSLRAIPFRQYISAFLFLLLLVSIAFATRWFQGRKMLFEILWDPIPVQLFYPGDRIESLALKNGKLALWDPYRGFGSRLIMPTAITLAHPLKLIAFLWGTDNGFEFMLLLRLVLAGFFSYILARGIGLSHLAGMVSAISYAFCGFFRQFHNFQDLNVEMFYPLALLFLIRLFQELKFFDLICCIWSGYFLITGGHPEPFYYFPGMIIVSGTYYTIEQLLCKTNKPKQIIFPRMFFIIFLILFFHMVHFIVEPGLEVFLRGWTYHPEGLGKLNFDIQHIIALFTPLFDFWLQSPRGIREQFIQFTAIPSYLGFFPGLLALYSIFNLRQSRGTLTFFWVFTIIMLGLLFGIPGFSWFLSLPFVNRLQNFRYFQSVLALLVSVLAGFGLDQLRKNTNLRNFLMLLSVLTLWLIFHLLRFSNYLLQNPRFLVAGALIIFSIALLFIIYFLRRASSGIRLAGALFFLVSAELFFYFIFVSPLYGLQAFQPEKPKFLERVNLDFHLYRLYSPDQDILPPDTASIWKLRDIRERGPLVPKEYYRMVSGLNGWKTEQDAVDAFLQNGRFYLPFEMDRIPDPAQDMLFGYLLTKHRLGTKSLLEKFQAGILFSPGPRYLSKAKYTVVNKSRDALLLHPPSRLKCSEKILNGNLLFEIGIMPAQGPQSDGAEFLLLGQTGSGARLLFYRFLPYSEAVKSGWKEYRLNLREQAMLELATLPGPRGNLAQDFALFGSMELGVADSPEYQLLDDSGPFLYQRISRVPRFFLSRNVEWVESQEKSLELIRQGKFSREKIFLSGKNPGLIPAQNSIEPSLGDEIYLQKDETDLVELELKLKEPAWLIMTDSYLSGWQAFLDGEEKRIYPANYYFRAVWIPSGAHRLKFLYHPLSFRIGFFKSIGFLIVGLVLTGLLIIRRIKTADGSGKFSA